jgi:hypothetical protein
MNGWLEGTVAGSIAGTGFGPVGVGDGAVRVAGDPGPGGISHLTPGKLTDALPRTSRPGRQGPLRGSS